MTFTPTNPSQKAEPLGPESEKRKQELFPFQGANREKKGFAGNAGRSGGCKGDRAGTWKKALRNLTVSLPRDWGRALRPPPTWDTYHPNVVCLIDTNNPTKLQKTNQPTTKPPQIYSQGFKNIIN